MLVPCAGVSYDLNVTEKVLLKHLFLFDRFQIRKNVSRAHTQNADSSRRSKHLPLSSSDESERDINSIQILKLSEWNRIELVLTTFYTLI